QALHLGVGLRKVAARLAELILQLLRNLPQRLELLLLGLVLVLDLLQLRGDDDRLLALGFPFLLEAVQLLAEGSSFELGLAERLARGLQLRREEGRLLAVRVVLLLHARQL